jgi:hypothetical protein
MQGSQILMDPGIACRLTSSWPGCAQSLDVFMAGDDVDKKKPDPMIYRIAAERLDVDPKHCLVVEDSIIGLQVLRRWLSSIFEACLSFAIFAL